MKKILLSLFLLGISSDEIVAQALKKGQNSLNIYYGVSLVRTFYKNLASQQAVDVEIKGLGPVGLVYEHMMSDKIGLGAEFGYGTTDVRYSETFQIFDIATQTNQTVKYNYEYNFTTIRAQLRMNLHFAESDNFDAYGFMSVGYRGTTGTFTSNDPNSLNETIPPILPFGLKFGLGLRYFFTKSFGLQTEFALGSPALSGGLAFRF